MRLFLCSNVQSLKVPSIKISGLLIFSEIGKLSTRKKFRLLEPGSVFKDNVTCNRVQTLEERLQYLDQPRSHLGGSNRRDPGYEVEPEEPFPKLLAYKVHPGSS